MWFSKQAKRGSVEHRLAARTRLTLEALEDRRLPSLMISDTFPTTSTFYADLKTADFNGDGRADLVDIRGDDAGDPVLDVRLNNGDGTFGPALTSATGFSGPLLGFPMQNLEIGDFNNDGRLDVAALDQAATQLRVFLGHGDGRFGSPVAVSLPPIMGEQQVSGSAGFFETDALAVGDLNEDGRLDLAVVATLPSTYTTYLNTLLGQGDGSFAAQTPVVLTGTEWIQYAPAANVSVGDFTGDGHLDVLSVARLGTSWSTRTDVLVHPGRGDGTFDPVRVQPGYSNELVRKLAPADLNGDGDLDFVAVSQNSYPAHVALGNGNGSFLPLQAVRGDAQIVDVAIADLNGDGVPDLVTVESTADIDHLGVHLGNGDGTFQPVRIEAHGQLYYGAATADFNGDGRIDVATNNVAALNDGAWDSGPVSPPALAIGDVRVTEGNAGSATAAFAVALSNASTEPIMVDYATADGSAVAGSDYLAASGTLIFAPGETSQTITVLVNGDTLVEYDEVFSVNLSNAVGATIVDGHGAGTIVNDDVPPPPTISISDVTKAEGKKGHKTLFTFTVTLSAAFTEPVTISYRTVNGTATSGDKDYVAKTGTLTFAPGETTKTITIEVKGDNKREADETFYLDLFGLSSNALFTKNRGIGTILNDD